MSNEFTWTCPRCARAVPRRLEACRCGHRRDNAASGAAPGEPPPPVPAAAPASAPPAPRAGVSSNVVIVAAGLVGLGVILAAALIGLSWIRSRQSDAPPATLLAAPGSAAASPASDAVDGDLVVPSLLELLAPATQDDPAPLSVEHVVARALPAVVKVETRDGFGSGFFVTPGTLLTNAHVVGSETSVTLRMSDGQRKKPAAVDDVWREKDLAVLKIDIVDPDQVVLPIAMPEDIRVGEEVVAIGSPLGLQNTVTRGIISGMRWYVYDRITPQGMEVVQTDAAINPGNSGGPLIDLHGRVVGVNTLKLAGETERLGFAVQMHYARRILGPEFEVKSAAVRRYENGLRTYEEMVGQLSRRADEVDARWARYRPRCFTPAAGMPAREWFVLWDGTTAGLRDAPSCGRGRSYFTGWAKVAHDALEEYNQNAREAGVQAVTLRTIRRKYNLAWPAWER